MAKLPSHGSTARYRLELKTKSVCERCRAANTKAKSRQRARAQQRGSNPLVSIVPDVQPARTSETTDDAPTPPAGHHVPAWSATEQAVRSDIDGLPADTPFLASLKAVAIALAREIDDVNAKGSKATAAKQLTDVIRELKSKGAASGDSFDALVSLFATPLVPTGDAAVLDAAEPQQPDARPTSRRSK